MLRPWLEALLQPACHRAPPQVITGPERHILGSLIEAERSIIWDASEGTREGRRALDTDLRNETQTQWQPE